MIKFRVILISLLLCLNLSFGSVVFAANVLNVTQTQKDITSDLNSYDPTTDPNGDKAPFDETQTITVGGNKTGSDVTKQAPQTANNVNAEATGLVQCGNLISNGTSPTGSIISNPCGFKDALVLLNRAMKFAVEVSFAFMVFVLVKAGFSLIQSQGKPDALKEAWKGIQKIVIGVIIMLCAWLVVYQIQAWFVNANFYTEIGGDGQQGPFINTVKTN